MRIALLCATHRGLVVLHRLVQLQPKAELFVFSFREDPWEPAFLDAIRELTLSSNGQFFETRQVGGQRLREFWRTTPIDLMLVVSWRYLIPRSVYQRPRCGTFVFHDSLLPEYRGFAPTVWSIINGEDHAGATLFEIAEAIDEGDIVDQQRIPIGPDDTVAVVSERTTAAYLEILERNLSFLLKGTACRHPQDHSRATYTCKRLPEDNQIDWTASAESIYNLIRAVSAPYPGAFTSLSGKTLHVWSARRLKDFRRYVGVVPGRVVESRPGEGAVVLTGDGALLLTHVQMESGPIVCAAEVLNSPTQTLGR